MSSVNNNNNVTAKQASSVTVQTATAATKQVPKPTIQKPSFIAGLFGRKIEQLAAKPLAPQAAVAPKVEAPKVEQKKGFDPSIALRVQNLLKDTSRSTFEKLKSLLPIPKSFAPFINMLLGKKTKADVKVGIENNALSLTAEVKMPGLGLNGTAVLSLPMTAQPEKEGVTELHPVIIDQLGKALNPLLSEEQQVKELIKLVSTLPSNVLKFTWSNGSADIIITLPNGASLNLNLAIPTTQESAKTPDILTTQESAKTPDILRTLLSTILKENYAGIETLLSREMIFNWDGSTSRFEIRFPQQLALHISEISSIDISNPILRKIVTAIGNNSTIIIPKNIRGTIDFKNPSIQFDKGTTFVINNAPIPEITIDRVSYDPITKKMSLTLKTSWKLFPDALLLKNIEIDMNGSPKKPSKKGAVEKPNTVKYAFVPVDTKDVPTPEIAVAPPAKATVSVFESLKKMIKIPDALAPLIKIFFADQTKVDLNVGIEDNLTVSVNNLNIPRLGISGKASLSIPATVQANLETSPVQLHPTLNKKLNKLLAQELNPSSLEEAALFNNLIDFALAMPNQNINMHWDGDSNRAQMAITLPGGMVLNLDLDIQKKDVLRTELLRLIDENPIDANDESKGWKQYQLFIALQKVVKIFGKDDARRAQVLDVLAKHGDKDTLRAELMKVLETDVLRTKLFEALDGEVQPSTQDADWAQFPLHHKLVEVVNTVGENDFRRAELLRVLGSHGDERTLRAALAKVLERDLLRTKLSETLGEQFDGLEPFLKQTFAFNWDGLTKAFKITFGEQQFINLKSLKLKKGGFFKNMLRKFVNWMAVNKAISLPREIRGNINFEDASLTFEKGTTFVVRGPLGITKRVSLRTISFARENMIDIGLRCFGTQAINLDTRTSNVDTASAAILSRGRSVKNHQ